jgi:DNA processing protein
MSHPLYWIALQLALGIPSKKVKPLLDFFGEAENVFEATEEELSACPALKEKQIDAILTKPFAKAKEILDTCQAENIATITPDEILYPDSLRNIPDMPCVLYVKGTMPNLNQTPAISIVGTRKPTPYGSLVCKQIASVVATAKVIVISGGALGIDTLAHQSALDAGGTTLAVLGCGVDSPYLKENRQLREQIVAHGALISEYPPQTPASPWYFPVRNRLIAALSLGTVVIEAGEKSGSLITANCALEQGKDVFVLPGSVMSPSFLGSNRILAQGARPVFSGLDVLKPYEETHAHQMDLKKAFALHKKQLNEMLVVQHVDYYFSTPSAPPEEKPQEKEDFSSQIEKNSPKPLPKDLSEVGGVVYNALLDDGQLSLDQLADLTQLSPSALMQELTLLELDGCIFRTADGYYKLNM